MATHASGISLLAAPELAPGISVLQKCMDAINTVADPLLFNTRRPIDVSSLFDAPVFDDCLTLRGLKQNTAVDDNPFIKKPLLEPSIVMRNDEPGASLDKTNTEVITSFADIRRFGPRIEGSEDYLKKVVNSDEQIAIVHRARRVLYTHKIDKNYGSFEPLFGKLSDDELAEHCAYNVVEETMFGAQLEMIYTIKSNKKNKSRDEDVEIMKGLIETGDPNLPEDIYSKFVSSDESIPEYTMDVKVQVKGGADVKFVSSLSDPTYHFEQANGVIRSFNSGFAQMPAQKAVPVAISLAPIAKYLDVCDLEKAVKIIGKIDNNKKNRQDITFTKMQIEETRNEIERDFLSDTKCFKEFHNARELQMIKINQRISECELFDKQPASHIETNLAPVKLTESEKKECQCLTGKCSLEHPVNLLGELTLTHSNYIGIGVTGMVEMHSEAYTGICKGQLKDDNQAILTVALKVEELAAEDKKIEFERDEAPRMLRGA